MTTLTFYPTHMRTDAISSFFAYDPYIEKYWLAALGPTATLLMNDLTCKSLLTNKPFYESAHELSKRIGTGARDGVSSPVMKQLARLVHAGIITHLEGHEYLIPKTIEPLNAQYLHRLDKQQRLDHDEWMSRLHISPVATQRRRAQSLIARLETMGTPHKQIQSALFSSGLHPSIIGEAITLTSHENTAA